MTQKKSERLLNLGPISRRWMDEVSIKSRADLQEIGAVAAYCLIKAQHPEASLNLLYALYGALTKQKWNELTQAEKEQLQDEVAGFRFGE